MKQSYTTTWSRSTDHVLWVWSCPCPSNSDWHRKNAEEIKGTGNITFQQRTVEPSDAAVYTCLQIRSPNINYNISVHCEYVMPELQSHHQVERLENKCDSLIIANAGLSHVLHLVKLVLVIKTPLLTCDHHAGSLSLSVTVTEHTGKALFSALRLSTVILEILVS